MEKIPVKASVYIYINDRVTIVLTEKERTNWFFNTLNTFHLSNGHDVYLSLSEDFKANFLIKGIKTDKPINIKNLVEDLNKDLGDFALEVDDTAIAYHTYKFYIDYPINVKVYKNDIIEYRCDGVSMETLIDDAFKPRTGFFLNGKYYNSYFDGYNCCVSNNSSFDFYIKDTILLFNIEKAEHPFEFRFNEIETVDEELMF